MCLNTTEKSFNPLPAINNEEILFIFQEVLNNHITRLQSSVGLTCGTVQEVSNKHLKVN